MGELDVSPVTFSVKAGPSSVHVKASTGAQAVLVPKPGAQGLRGQPGADIEVFAEVPSGAINGTNVTFTLANNYQHGSTAVYLNSLREVAGDSYTESGLNTITFSDAPLPGDKIRVDYLIA